MKTLSVKINDKKTKQKKQEKKPKQTTNKHHGGFKRSLNHSLKCQPLKQMTNSQRTEKIATITVFKNFRSTLGLPVLLLTALFLAIYYTSTSLSFLCRFVNLWIGILDGLLVNVRNAARIRLAFEHGR